MLKKQIITISVLVMILPSINLAADMSSLRCTSLGDWAQVNESGTYVCGGIACTNDPLNPTSWGIGTYSYSDGVPDVTLNGYPCTLGGWSGSSNYCAYCYRTYYANCGQPNNWHFTDNNQQEVRDAFGGITMTGHIAYYSCTQGTSLLYCSNNPAGNLRVNQQLLGANYPCGQYPASKQNCSNCFQNTTQ